MARSTLTWFCEEVNMSVLYFSFQPSTSLASPSGPRIMNGGALDADRVAALRGEISHVLLVGGIAVPQFLAGALGQIQIDRGNSDPDGQQPDHLCHGETRAPAA